MVVKLVVTDVESWDCCVKVVDCVCVWDPPKKPNNPPGLVNFTVLVMLFRKVSVMFVVLLKKFVVL